MFLFCKDSHNYDYSCIDNYQEEGFDLTVCCTISKAHEVRCNRLQLVANISSRYNSWISSLYSLVGSQYDDIPIANELLHA